MKQILEPRSILLLMVLCVLSTSCKKKKYKRECCKGQLKIETVKYNKEEVAFYAPNAFTPNGDQENDYFKILIKGAELKTIKIFKEDELLAESSALSFEWDGRHDGEVNYGIYNYTFTAETIHNELLKGSGEFCLIDQSKVSPSDCSSCIFGDMMDVRQGVRYESGEQLDCD